jgi:hypothetical protein
MSTSAFFDLVRQWQAAASKNWRRLGGLEKLAAVSQAADLSADGFVSLINVDGGVDRSWSLAGQNVKSLQDYVAAMPLIDPVVRAASMTRSSRSWRCRAARLVPARASALRAVRLLARHVTLKSKFIATARHRPQSRAAREHSPAATPAGRSTATRAAYRAAARHTEANRPYWELDLGQELPIDQIVIYNRTNGDLGKRLNEFSLSILDGSRDAVFKQEKLPAPTPSSMFELSGGGPAANIRRAAMTALTSSAARSRDVCPSADFVKDSRSSGGKRLQQIPRTYWAEPGQAMLDVIVADVTNSATERASPAILDAARIRQPAREPLAGRSGQAAAELRGCVRAIRLMTIFEKCRSTRT